MAKLLYLKEGQGPERLRSGPEITVDLVLSKVAGRKVQYAGPTPPHFPIAGLDLTAYRDPICVLVDVSASELNDVFDKPGYYLLHGVKPAEAEKWV